MSDGSTSVLKQNFLPIEVLAFDLDILHTIASFTLPLAAVGLFLTCTHYDSRKAWKSFLRIAELVVFTIYE